MIKSAAIKNPLKVWSLPAPARHHNIIALMHDKDDPHVHGVSIQGFLTHEGKFLNRKEAAKYVLEVGQLKKLKWPPNLFSEDLW